MTTVNLNNTSGAELATMLSEMQAAGEISKVSYGTMENGVIPLTITTNSGQVVTVNAELPEVDPSEGEGVDAADKQALEGAVSDLAEDTATVSSSTRKSGLADIYQVLALLYESAQKQRESSLQARQAEHKATQASLEGQAEAAKTAADEAYTQALNSAITQAVTAGISLAASATSFGLQVKATVCSPDVKVAKNDLSSAKSELATANDMPKSLEKLETADAATTQKSLDGNEAALKAKESYTKADAEVNSRQEALKVSQGELDVSEKQMKSDKSALDKAMKDGAPAEEIEKLKGNLGDSTDKFRAGQEQVGRDMNALDKAKIDRGDKALAYGAELDKATKADPGNAELASFAKTEKQAIRSSAIDGSKLKCEQAYAKVNNAVAAAEKSGEYLGSRGLDVLSQTSMQIGRTTGAFFDAESQHISGTAQSKSKSAEAEQENLRAQTESTNELCQSEQDLLNFINEMLKQISQTESNTVSAAIRV